MKLERKSLDVKALPDTPGAISAVFATLNVIDKDGDVTIPGAFEPNAAVNIAAWGHNWGDLPSGDGKIREDGNRAIFEGSFYLGTPQGDATYSTIKARLDRGTVTQEWSYGFSVEDSSFGQFNGQQVRFLRKLKVYEVSPVLVGAGEGTQTLDVKGMKFIDELEAALAAVKGITERSASLADARAKEGRQLSAANVSRLRELLSALDEHGGSLRALLDAADPEPEKAADVMALFLDYQRIEASMKGGF